MTMTIPPVAPAPAAPADDKLDRILGALDDIARAFAGSVQAPVTSAGAAPVTAAAAQPSPAPRPAGMAAVAGPIPPEPPPPPPAEHATPHPDETFAPNEFAYYTYHRNGDPEGTDRTQLVAVVRVSDSHVYGLVLGDAQSVAQFGAGQLTHEPPG